MPLDRPVTGEFDLAHELRLLRDELARTGARTARTLVKEGGLRVTLVGINPGGELRPHQAAGPISVHVLEGEIAFEAGDRHWTLGAGRLLSLGPGVRHGVRSAAGGVFLLTIAALEP